MPDWVSLPRLQGQNLKLWEEKRKEGGGDTIRPHPSPATLASLGRHALLCQQKADGEQGAAVNNSSDS